MKFSTKLVLMLLAALTVTWLLYSLFGNQLINCAYEGKSIGFLNNLIHGRGTHSVQFYFESARGIIINFSIYTIFICLVIVFLNFLLESFSNWKAGLFGILLCLVLFFVVEVILVAPEKAIFR